MKAAIITRFGSRWSIEVRQVPKPVPAAGEVLVRVRAATVNRTDCGELRHPLLERLIIARGTPGRSILGLDFAGEIEAVGAGVSGFKAGDRVFGMGPRGRNGAQAEYFCMPETGAIGSMAEAVPFDRAVACEGAYYADPALKAVDAGPGDKILVYGASGAIGTAAVQLAKYYGADVTAVVATRHLDMARSLGADRVVDYTTPEFRQLGRRFGLVFDAVGKMTLFQRRRLLKPGRTFATTDLGPWAQNIPFLLWSWINGRRRFIVALPPRGSARAFVNFLMERMVAGEFRAVVDRKYPLDAIADAYRYVQTGQKAGIVVIDV